MKHGIEALRTKKTGPVLGPVFEWLELMLIRFHVARNNRPRMRLRLRSRDRSLPVTRCNVRDEIIHHARADRRTETRRRVPVSPGRISGNSHWVIRGVELEGRVGAGRDVVKCGRVQSAVRANRVDTSIEKSLSMGGLLIHDRSDGCPLRGTTTGTAEAIEAGRYARNVQVGQDAVKDGAVVGDVGHPPLCAAANGALLICGFAEQHAESTTGRLGGGKEVLEVAKGAFIPHDLAQVRPRQRMRAGIATEGRKAIVRCT